MHTDALDNIMWTASTRWVWIPLYVLLLILLVLRYRKKEYQFTQSTLTSVLIILALLAVSVGLADWISSGLLKPLIARPRPTHEPALAGLLHIVNGYTGGPYGFPSSHAANTCAVTLFFALVYKDWRLTLGLVVWMLLNCYSRMYLGVHYPLDIVAGLLVGVITGCMAAMALLIIKRFLHNHDTERQLS